MQGSAKDLDELMSLDVTHASTPNDVFLLISFCNGAMDAAASAHEIGSLFGSRSSVSEIVPAS